MGLERLCLLRRQGMGPVDMVMDTVSPPRPPSLHSRTSPWPAAQRGTCARVRAKTLYPPTNLLDPPPLWTGG